MSQYLTKGRLDGAKDTHTGVIEGAKRDGNTQTEIKSLKICLIEEM